MGDSSARLLAVASASAIAGSVLTLAAIRLHRSLRRADGYEQGECGTCSSSRSELATPSSSQQKRDPFDPSPRSHYLNWDDYFMAVAFLSAQRSKDPNKQVGACIVDSRQVICGIGYNGFPRGCADELLPWAKASTSGDPLCTKYPYVCHAEMNAILNKNGASVAGARVFVTMFPCNECAKLLIQAGISEVIYHEDKDAGPGRRPDSPSKDGFRRDQQYAASRRLLALAGVKVRQHRFRRPVALHLSNNPWRPAVRTPLESEAAAADAGAGAGGGEPAAAALEQQGEQQRRAEPAAIDPALAAALLASSLGSGSGTRASSSLAAEEDREATSSGGCSGDEAVARVADAASTPPGTRYHTPRSFALTSPMS